MLRRVQLAQAKMAHCVMNKGYNNKNGGFGTVMAMTTEQKMLKNQAVISKAQRTGWLDQSARIQATILSNS